MLWFVFNWNHLVGVIWSVLLNQSLIVSLFQVQNTIKKVTFTWQLNKNSKYLIFSTSAYFMTSALSRYDVTNLTHIFNEFQFFKMKYQFYFRGSFHDFSWHMHDDQVQMHDNKGIIVRQFDSWESDWKIRKFSFVNQKFDFIIHNTWYCLVD